MSRISFDKVKQVISHIPFSKLKEDQYFEIENIPFRRGNDLGEYGQCTRLLDLMQVHPKPEQTVRVINIHEAKRLVDKALGKHLLCDPGFAADTLWNYDVCQAIERNSTAKQRVAARKRRQKRERI